MPQASKRFSGIFISYRREDSAGHAGRLFDSLINHFGKDRVFMDLDTIQPGEDFVSVIENAVASCEILIAIIGQQWLPDASATAKWLNDPNNYVRVEIATALNRDIRVIPVLVQRATMPKPQDLPDDMMRLSRRNAVELSDARWQQDTDRLISVLEAVLDQGEGLGLGTAPAIDQTPNPEVPEFEEPPMKPVTREEESVRRPSFRKIKIFMVVLASVALLAIVANIWLLRNVFRQSRPKNDPTPTSTRTPLMDQTTIDALTAPQAVDCGRRARYDIDAERCYKRAVKLEPNNASYNNDLGKVLAKQDKHAEAEFYFKKAVSLQSKNAALRNDLGLCLYRQKNPKEALTHLLQAVELDDQVAEYHNNLADVLYDLKQYDDAESHYIKAWRLEPYNSDYQGNLRKEHINRWDLLVPAEPR